MKHDNQHPPRRILNTWALAVGAVLAAGILAVTIDRHRDASGDVPAITDAQRFAALDSLQGAAEALAAERGLAYVALSAAEPAAAEVHVAIIQSRSTAGSRSDGALADARAALGESGTWKRRGWIGSFDRLPRLRRRIDANLQLAGSERDRGLADEWLIASSGAIKLMRRMFEDIQSALRTDSPSRIAGLQVQLQAWDLAEYAGFERALLGAAAVSTSSVSPTRLAQLRHYRQRLMLAWLQLDALARSGGLQRQVLDQVEATRRSLIESVTAKRSEMFAAAQQGTVFPMAAHRWFAEATRAIDMVHDLARLARDSAKGRVSPG